MCEVSRNESASRKEVFRSRQWRGPHTDRRRHDYPVVLAGVRNMLMNEPGFDVVSEARDGDEAITQTFEHEPDILLLDLAMPRLPGLEAMRAIMAKSPRVKIVLLTSTISTQQIIEALQIGARGIILKESVAGDLTQALRAVLGGDYWIGGERVANLLKALQELQAQAARPFQNARLRPDAPESTRHLHRGRMQQPRYRDPVLDQ